jgi:hypothetical protein
LFDTFENFSILLKNESVISKRVYQRSCQLLGADLNHLEMDDTDI